LGRKKRKESITNNQLYILILGHLSSFSKENLVQGKNYLGAIVRKTDQKPEKIKEFLEKLISSGCIQSTKIENSRGIDAFYYITEKGIKLLHSLKEIEDSGL